MEVEDIFACVLTEWIDFRDRVRLDLVLRGSRRSVLHKVLRRMPMAPPFSQRRCTIENNMFQWMGQRQIYRTSGVWVLDIDGVQRYLADPLTRPILQHMEHMDLRYRDIAFDWNQFAACQHLKSLRLLHFRANREVHGIGLPLTQPIFPMLEKVSLQNCLLSMDLLTVFSHCERLVEVEYTYCIDGPGQRDCEALWPYFQRLRIFRFNGDVDTLLMKYLPQRELGLTTLHLEHASDSDGEEPDAALANLLRLCPQLTDVKIWEYHSLSKSTMAAISGLEQLERLHFNYCKWISGDVLPAALMPRSGSSKRLQTLWISGPRLLDMNMTNVLRGTATSVRNLRLSLYSFGSITSLCAIIAQHAPQLQCLTIDFEKHKLSARELAEVKGAFGHLPRLLVQQWEEFSRWCRHEGKAVVLDVTNN